MDVFTIFSCCVFFNFINLLFKNCIELKNIKVAGVEDVYEDSDEDDRSG